jgi:hypothetical protein
MLEYWDAGMKRQTANGEWRMENGKTEGGMANGERGMGNVER